MNRLIIFKEKNHGINGKLKSELEKLPKIVSTKKEKSVKLIVGEIKEHLRSINQAEKKLEQVIIKNIDLKQEERMMKEEYKKGEKG